LVDSITASCTLGSVDFTVLVERGSNQARVTARTDDDIQQTTIEVMFALIVAQIFGANKSLEFDEEGLDSPLSAVPMSRQDARRD
jgi:hypothetical protein